MAAHRYWRIYITNHAGFNNYLDISEIELRTSIGGADATGTGTAMASSAGSGYPASSAFDNTTSTTWFTDLGSNPLPQWIGYDFGAGNAKDIVEFSTTCWASAENPTCFQLQYSDDNVTWTTLYDIQGEVNWSNGETRVFHSGTFTGVAAKALWRIRSTSVNGGTVFGLSELAMSDASGVVTSGGTPYASSVAEGLVSYLFNGAFGPDHWNGSTPAEWVAYKFSSPKDIISVTPSARNDTPYNNQAPKDFVVEYWDGTSFQPAFSVTGASGWGLGESRTFNAYGATPADLNASFHAAPFDSLDPGGAYSTTDFSFRGAPFVPSTSGSLSSGGGGSGTGGLGRFLILM